MQVFPWNLSRLLFNFAENRSVPRLPSPICFAGDVAISKAWILLVAALEIDATPHRAA